MRISIFLIVLMLAGCAAEKRPEATKGATVNEPQSANEAQSAARYERPSDEELRERLSPLQWKVTQESGTEPAFRNPYHDEKRHGLYVDIVTGEPLFSSLDKFDSGCGWPSFTKPLETTEIAEIEDRSHGMVRTEVRSSIGDAHLGHVFNDGPKDRGGLRYCINSASLRFIPVEDLEKEGYGMYRPMFEKAGVVEKAVKTEEAILAGGCFWGMEEIIRAVPGVIETEVGYSGGTVKNATYSDVKSGRTGHAEALRVVFDPAKLSFETLLRDWFFRMHDPTTLNRQGNDRGSQYRSAIFYGSDKQKRTAERVKKEVENSGRWEKPIVTEITQAGEFWSAEDYHQNYLQKNPGGYTCHWMRD